ncbi:MAG: vitamin B12 dependent methionine synthase [Syntrophaceae bacterium]|nr:vitamin B12 dependent methionine synthase [Syntrophaceae bacterium]
MKSTILEALPFKVDRDALKKNLRIKEGTEMVGKLERMVREAENLARPKVCFRVAYVESKGDDHLMIEGVQFTSRVLRVNLDKVYRIFPYVATCGLELEEWSKSVEGILEQFWAEEIKVLAVRGTIRYLQDYLTDRYQPGPMSRMNPGSLPDWPLSEQGPLFALLGSAPAAIGVQLKDSFLMTPVKSVSGIWFPTEEKFESCQLCQREKCPGRRAPYAPGLMEQKYR